MIRRRIAFIMTVVGVLLVGGTIGFHTLERWTWLDSVYMTVITLTTVGFGDFHPVTMAGKIFSISLILVGVGTMAYLLSSLYEILASDEARNNWQKRGRQRMIDRLDNHVIICGFGDMGCHVAQDLEREGAQFLIVELDEDEAHRATASGYNVLQGSGSDESVLEGAGIQRARALVITVDSDAESVFIVLTARALRQDIFIVSRANRDDSRPKLERAGADRVILPYALSGNRMVSLVNRPAVTEFLDVVTQSADLAFCLDEIRVPDDSPLAGQSLVDLRARQDYGVTVLAIAHPGRGLSTNPQGSDIVAGGSRLIALGTADALEAFRIGVRGA
ncbi:MAG: potassium channel protein [Planctomycetes bacterium]|nr:potassium channel protein [Planctomycetota bacterium]